jgi:NAD(P)-dependent dehydrogenase (short-subunit alcohol dehydrogenase family)
VTIERLLENRTCLITGASSGLGAHFARLYADAGANVVLGARRLDRVTALAEKIGDKALAVQLDVTDEASVIAAFDTAEVHFGGVEVVVANAGMVLGGRATEVPPESLRSLIDTNFLGVYLTAREGGRRMIAAGTRETGRGRIILIGSITSHQTASGDSCYAATKAAVAHLGRNLAREWVRQGINVNTVQPGYIDTDINGDWFHTEGGKAQIAGFHRRRLQLPRSLDGIMLYFAGDASDFTTGAVIDIDDGQSL